MPPNPYLLAADNSPALLPLLRENPALAAAQDQHGYSLLHAAASYNHLDLLRALVHEFRVPVDLRDEDAETALFVVETVDAARVLVEELGLDPELKGSDGVTARVKIESEGDFPEVARYLGQVEGQRRTINTARVNGRVVNGTSGEPAAAIELPPAPQGLQVRVEAVTEPESNLGGVDPEFRRRIEQLAAREDYHSAEGQAELRRLVEDAISGQGLAEERSVRPRQS